MTEGERYLAKARESLASARADFRARRYNSSANRAYYAAFQAAIAALVALGFRAEGHDWSHRFVMSSFSGTLVRRRKLLPSRYRRTLDDLFDARVNADYSAANITERWAKSGVRSAGEIVDAVAKFVERGRIAEARTDYGSGTTMTTAAEYRKKAAELIGELKDTILAAYPDCTFDVYERTPKDYRVIARCDSCDQLDVQDLLDGRKSDILLDEDIWIVLLVQPQQEKAA